MKKFLSFDEPSLVHENYYFCEKYIYMKIDDESQWRQQHSPNYCRSLFL